MAKKAAPLKDILNGPLSALYHRAQKLNAIEKILPFYVDKQLLSYIHPASYVDGVLSFFCDNQTAASQLAYLSKVYIQQFKQHPELRDLKKIRYSIHAIYVSKTTLNPVQPSGRKMSAASAQALTSLAEQFEDAEISEALIRLASHSHQENKV
jgi:hypothetical protein